MPDFTPDDIEIEPSEFVDSCSTRELGELVDALVDIGYLPKNVLKLNKKNKIDDGLGRLQSEFANKLQKLTDVYYTISTEDEEVLQTIINKYI